MAELLTFELRGERVYVQQAWPDEIECSVAFLRDAASDNVRVDAETVNFSVQNGCATYLISHTVDNSSTVLCRKIVGVYRGEAD
jgi:hypothetical protein